MLNLSGLYRHARAADPAIARALAMLESEENPFEFARSGEGAVGLWQMKPIFIAQWYAELSTPRGPMNLAHVLAADPWIQAEALRRMLIHEIDQLGLAIDAAAAVFHYHGVGGWSPNDADPDGYRAAFLEKLKLCRDA